MKCSSLHTRSNALAWCARPHRTSLDLPRQSTRLLLRLALLANDRDTLARLDETLERSLLFLLRVALAVRSRFGSGVPARGFGQCVSHLLFRFPLLGASDAFLGWGQLAVDTDVRGGCGGQDFLGSEHAGGRSASGQRRFKGRSWEVRYRCNTRFWLSTPSNEHVPHYRINRERTRRRGGGNRKDERTGLGT